jgi:hypothetical protein
MNSIGFDGSPYISSPFWTVQVHSLVTPVITRWSSALKLSVKLRRPIDEIPKDVDLRKNELNREERSVLDQVLEFFEEFATITKYIKGSGYPT